MSDATLTVPTAFVDISQLAEGLADRVDEGRLMLYGPDSYEEGSWVRFSVLLEDQSAALEGVGRVVTSIDGGDERPEVARWDVVLDNLQFDGTAEVVYERILMVRQSAFGEEQSTGEVSLDDIEAVDEGEALPDEEMAMEATAVAQSEDYAEQVGASAHDEPAATDDYGQPADYGAFDDGANETVVGAAPDGYEDAITSPGHVSAEAPEPVDPVDQGVQVSGFDAASDDDVGVWPREAVTADVDAGEVQDVSAEEAVEGYDGSYGQEVEYVDEAHYGHEAVEYAQPVHVSREEGSIPAAAPPPEAPRQPGGFELAALGADGQVLARASRGASWYPEVVPPPDPRPSSGLFAFAGGLPHPPAPPRPEIDPSMRIRPAPRPQNGGGGEAHVAGYASAPPVAYESAPPISYESSPPSYEPPPLDTTDPAFAPPDIGESAEPGFESSPSAPDTSDWDEFEDSTRIDVSNPDDDEER